MATLYSYGPNNPGTRVNTETKETNMAKYAFMQMRIIPGNVQQNFETMRSYISIARGTGADHFVFPEMTLSGYLIGDAWEEAAFLEEVTLYQSKVSDLLKEGETIFFGGVTVVANRNGNDGRVLKFNSAIMHHKSSTEVSTQLYYKILMPNYREFDESRHFKAGSAKQKNVFYRTRVSICEDGWDSSYEEKPLSVPSQDDNYRITVNMSSSPFTLGKNSARDRIFSDHAARSKRPLAYVNNVGIQDNGKTVYTFDGSSCLYGRDGKIIARAPSNQEAIITYDTNTEGAVVTLIGSGGHSSLTPSISILKESQTREYPRTMASLVGALVSGLSEYYAATGAKKIVIGVSGGVDSCVVTALAALALNRLGRPVSDIVAVNMPTKFNSNTTIGIAQKMCDALGIKMYTAPIGSLCRETEDLLDKDFKLTQLNRENIQARARSASVLAMYASAVGGVYTCNGNKSELTVGYCTLGGDLSGFLAPIADLWKHQVYDLVPALNRSLRKELVISHDVIPAEVITIPASAELSDDQSVDAGKGDPIVYWYHDRLFRTWVENWDRLSSDQIIAKYKDGTINNFLDIPEPFDVYELFDDFEQFNNDLSRWRRNFLTMGVVKRVQAPPVLAVSRRSFGFDYRESVLAKHRN